ncbi:MotA/TolQ/ExbB proton channel family protein [Mitsuaria sp. CC2]|uniref:hypothetical protein n=1 Tax=Mitsuaria sp. CC2 TaxID=3029186 RepID=UPI003B8B619A
MPLRHKLSTASDWIQAGWPFLLTVSGGGLFFGHAIVASIESTPHPALVYIIFGALVVALLSAWLVLFQLHRDERLARLWEKLSVDEFAASEPAVSRGSPFRDAYALLAQQDARASEDGRRELERRLHAGERAFGERLSLPGFIAGGLVGLGLVGTFIGLLGALNELAQLFSGMTGGGSDPAAMLGGMMAKLQAPMKSMGTAFIASLYGLLGSLLLGVTLVAVQKIRLRVTTHVHDVLIDAFDRARRGSPTLPRLPQESEAEHARWQAVLRAIEGLQDMHHRQLAAAMAPLVRVESALECLVGIAAQALDQTPAWLDQGAQLREQIAQLRSLEESTARAVLHALQSQQQSAHRLVELATLTHEADRTAASERDLRDAALQQSLQGCRDAFEDVSGRLRTLLLNTSIPVRA